VRFRSMWTTVALPGCDPQMGGGQCIDDLKRFYSAISGLIEAIPVAEAG
jgi:hypothetical protein